MKYIKFKKAHSSGISKDEILKIPKDSLSAWVNSGYVSESSEKEFDKQTKNRDEMIENMSKEARKKNAEKIKESKKVR